VQDVTYVDNVVEALLRCATAPSSLSGRVYNITNGEPRPIGAILTTLFGGIDRSLRRRDLPYRVAYALASLCECSASLRDAGEPALTRYGVIALGRDMTLDITRARSELGYAPTVGLDEGLERFARWSRRH
jgi:nucleoside-diphosphate-sugar epimerase